MRVRFDAARTRSFFFTEHFVVDATTLLLDRMVGPRRGLTIMISANRESQEARDDTRIFSTKC